MKNEKAFQEKLGVCYIPEAEDSEYTYEDLLNISGGNVKLSESLFDLLEWQHPETLIDEWMREDEIDEDYNFISYE